MAMIAAEVMGVPLEPRAHHARSRHRRDHRHRRAPPAAARPTRAAGACTKRPRMPKAQLLDWAVRKLVDDGKKKNPPRPSTSKPKTWTSRAGSSSSRTIRRKKLKIADVISFAGDPILGGRPHPRDHLGAHGLGGARRRGRGRHGHRQHQGAQVRGRARRRPGDQPARASSSRSKAASIMGSARR